MNIGLLGSRQPVHQPWTLDRLQRERAIAIGASLEQSSILVYNSHFQSYLNFCKMHNLPTDPTPDTLSYYTVYMCHHIKPESVGTYLSGICSSLEPFFPNVRLVRKHHLVTQTLAGMKKLRSGTVNRQRPLLDADLCHLLTSLNASRTHDTKLLLAIIFVGFHALMRLGELTWPDKTEHQDWRKVILRHSVQAPTAIHVSFFLPFHKADRLYEGNVVMVQARSDDLDPIKVFKTYLQSHDSLFPFSAALWLREDGSIPRYS